MISGEPIAQKASVKYLGVNIDNKLKWKDHIKTVASKVTRAIVMIRYTKKFIPKHTLKMLYKGLLEPHFRSCCSVWGTCVVTSCCTLEKLQNRVIRIIADSPYDAPPKPLLRQLRLPSIADMIRQESASMVYKAIYGQAPTYLSSLFNSISAATNRMLRNSNLYLRPSRMKTKFGQNSFAYVVIDVATLLCVLVKYAVAKLHMLYLNVFRQSIGVRATIKTCLFLSIFENPAIHITLVTEVTEICTQNGSSNHSAREI